MGVLEQLQAAADKERKMMVAYYGGSNPGDIRELTPISVDEETRCFQAVCHISNEVKTFRVDDTEIIGRATSTYHWEPKPSKFSLMFSGLKSRLELAGWFALAGVVGLGALAVITLVLWIVYKIISA
ncbi:WYL domain-containing protein [Vibrio sp. SM6]|uniref:WYL domain-containing protein n=2 Tax=Vibrio TaxID=662 RepID=A0A7X8TTZ5_9VIBR|nr:WYL domain-containing protein [Vibrio agarilyticus]NLS14760.1 WYL domain-containing protein [Vibrio agarilyticus]